MDFENPNHDFNHPNAPSISQPVDPFDFAEQQDPMELSAPDVAPRLLTLRQTAAMLAVSVKSVRKLLSSGELRQVRIGRCVRVPANRVDEFINGGPLS